MQARFLCLIALAAATLTGCQSYYPYGYAGTGPYPSPPPGSFAPPQGSCPPPQGTYIQQPRVYGQAPPPRGYIPPGQNGPVGTYGPQGRTYAPTGPISSVPQNRAGVTAQPTSVRTTPIQTTEQPVPKPVEARSIPESVGGAVLDEDADEIKGSGRDSGGTGSSGTGATRRSSPSFTEESDEAVDTIGSDDFVSPRSPIKRASGVAESSRRGRKSPYSKRSDYRKLSGILSQDRQSGEWQLTYDPDGNDEYGGTLPLAHDEALEHLVEGDAIEIHGRIDSRNTDRFGRPRYRAEPNRLKLLIDQDEAFSQ
ncbi:MAG: hypothetical protein NT069_05870 [Planctomycetota bacterium]|nr:hypothetical protein [Planctomycetota bacterium]